MKNERKNAEYRTGEDVERRHDWEREHAGRSRPHLAPCSCELHQALREALERNRELESSLHMEQMRVHDLKQDMEEGLDYLRVREQQLEIEKARVAELEKERHELRLAVFDTETLRVKEREDC